MKPHLSQTCKITTTLRFVLVLVILTLYISCQPSRQSEDTLSMLSIKDSQIEMKQEGNGPPVLMVHGGYLDLNMWTPQVGHLKDRYTVTRFSDLGHGQTIAGDLPLLGHEIMDTIIVRQDLDKPTLIGLSWGAMLCVDYVLNHPDNVERLILISPGLSGWDYFQDTLAAANYQLRQEAISKGDTLTAASLFHKNWVIGPRRNSEIMDDRFLRKSMKMIKSTMTHHWQEDWSSLDSLPALSRLDEIKVPTYILYGDQDALDIKMIVGIYQSTIPNAQKIKLQNVGHLATMEDPDQVNRLLDQILE